MLRITGSKLLIVSIFFILTLSQPILSFAVNNPIRFSQAQPIILNGLKDASYVAIGTGYDTYKMHEHINFSNSTDTSLIYLDPEIAATGIIGEFALGYGKYLGKSKRAYAGVEVFVSGSGADGDFEVERPLPKEFDYEINKDVIDTDVIVNGSLGLYFVPAFLINKYSKLYFKLGYSWSLVSIDETTRVCREFDCVAVEVDQDKVNRGFTYGVGLESAFYDEFSLRAELINANYTAFYTDSATKVDPSSFRYLIGLVYHFKL